MAFRRTATSKAAEGKPVSPNHMGSLHLIERGSIQFPAWLRDDGLGNDGIRRAAPTCQQLQRHLKHLRRKRGRPVSPRSRRSPRSRLPRCQCWSVAHGLAAHSAARLARWSAHLARVG